MRLFRLLVGIVAAVFVFGPVALYVAGVRPVAFENRPLASAPDPGDGWDALNDLPPWAADHVPARKRLVEAGAWLDYFVFGTLPDAAPGEKVYAPIPGPGGPFVASPQVVRGGDGYLFFGEDFDASCINPAFFPNDLTGLTELAHSIEATGRRVVFAVAPNKSSVVPAAQLPRFLPHGQCTADGIVHQKAALGAFEDSIFLPLLPVMQAEQAAGRSMYWKSDTHWSPAGSALYAQLLTEKLDPQAARQVHVVTGGEVTRVGDLAALSGLRFTETQPEARVETGARPRWTSRNTEYDTPADRLRPHSWRSAGGAPITGRTVIIGDSFTYFALPNLRPLFADAEFFWSGVAKPDAIVAGLAKADTVVIQVVQRYVGPYDRQAMASLRLALEADPLPPPPSAR